MTYQETIWDESPSLKSYTLANFRDIPQIQNFSEQTQFEMEVVGNVLPFKANNYVVEQLIDWKNIPNDPMYVLTFPQKGMLKPEHFEKMSTTLKNNSDKKEITNVANEIRLQTKSTSSRTNGTKRSYTKRWNKTVWNATQIQRNMSVFPKSKSNLSCIL